MTTESVFHEDVFYAHFQPFRHPSSHSNIWGGLGLETFGGDLQLVRSFAPYCVWTVLEGDVGPDLWISPGLHHVNRICYLLTRVPHNDAPISFRTEGKPRPITPRGLARRLTTLRRIMQVHQNQLHLAY
jgi:hypothetical protein